MQLVQQKTKEVSSLLQTAKHYARAFGRIGPEEPEDLAQQAVVTLLTNCQGRPIGTRLLYTVVRNTAVNAFRKHRYELANNDGETDWEKVPDPSSDPEHQHERGIYDPACDECDPELWQRLRAALLQISQPLRQTLILFAQGHTYEEIGTLTGAGPGTVRSRLHYARKQAKVLLGDKE